jgi:hypothetical protein
MRSSWTKRVLNLFRSTLLAKHSSQTLTNPSFSNAPIGNPEKALKQPIDDRL